MRSISLLVLLVALGASPLYGENLLRNASFEVIPSDVISAGYNRCARFPFRDEVALRVATRPLVTSSSDQAELEDLGDFPGRAEPLGWRFVKEPDKAKHGDISMRTDLKEAYSWGMELLEGTYTFSIHALSREKEMLKVTCTDVRGSKGEVLNEQDKAFELGKEWVRGVFSCSVVRGPVTWTVETLGEGTVWIDAIQLESGDQATPFQLHPWDQSPPRDIDAKPQAQTPAVLDGLAPVSPDAVAKPGQAGSVALHVSLPPDAPAEVVPASGGIPLPRGHVFDERRIRLLDASGQEVPIQTRVLSRHVADGSIQMVLVDLLAATPDAQFQLSYGPENQRRALPTPLRVDDRADQIEIVTGPLKFRVGKQRFALVDTLWFDRNGDGQFSDGEVMVDSGGGNAGVWVMDPVGRMYWGTLGPVEFIRVEEAGPVRACIAAAGSHRSAEGQILFRYVVRIHAYAGKPYLRIEHVFSNQQPPYATIMTGVGLRLRLKDGWAQQFQPTDRVGVPIVPGKETYLAGSDVLRRWVDDTAQIVQRQGEGWATVKGEAVGLTATIREWDWMPPKEFAVSAENGLDICFWPRHLTRGFCVPQGVARSHRSWLWMHPGNVRPEERKRMLNLFRGESLVEAPPPWYCESEVFGPLAARDKERLPFFEVMLDRPGEGTYGHFPRPGEYSWHDFITYGDDRGDLGWGNMETMIDHSIFLLYVRSLEPWYFRRACDAAIHYRDVDVCHPWGQIRVHCHNHTISPWDGSHDWIKGVLDHYLLTGDPRSLEVAHEYGSNLRSRAVEYEIRRGTRRFTRLVENAADLYRFTGHKEYLDDFTARISKAEEMRGDHPDISRFQLSDLFREGPPVPSYGTPGFPQFYAIEGVMQMARATGDERWKKVFLEEMAFITAVEVGKKGGPTDQAASCLWGASQGRRLVEADTRNRVFLPCLNYLYELTGDRTWVDAGRYAAMYATTDTGWKGWWPNIGWAGSVWFAHALYYPMKEGLTAKDESACRNEARALVLRTSLRDPGFEETGYSAWASGNERANIELVYDVTKDKQEKVEGQCSLRIAEKTGLDKLARKKAFDFPPPLSRQKVFLTEPGRFEFSGFVRIWKHGRPEIAIFIDGDSGKRTEIPLGLTALLPDRRYDDIEKGPQDVGQTDGTAGDEGKEKEDAETIFEGPKEEDRPEDHWWRVRVVFDTEETSILQFQLNHVLGLRPPGAVWFDGFSLQRVKENETKSPPGKVEVEMMPKGFKLSGN